MNLEHVTFLTSDHLELPGLLFTPHTSTHKAAIYLHGNGDSGVFYGATLNNEMGKALNARNIAYFAFNNRGAHYRKKIKIKDGNTPEEREYITGGVHYELIEDCVKDIDGAVALLRSRGFSEFYLVGFSTGANKICVYDYLSKTNPFSKYVHAGPGDDSGLYFNELGKRRFHLSLDTAKKLLRSNPLHIMPQYTGMHPFSAQSAYDILDPNGHYNTFPYFETTTKRLGKKELFKEYKSITLPMLVVFGAHDEFTYTGGGTESTLNLLKKYTHPKALSQSNFQIIPNTDHGFHGAEKDLAVRISTWLS